MFRFTQNPKTTGRGLPDRSAESLRRARGSILILVLWTVVVLGIIGLNFAFQTRTHVTLASHYATTCQLRNIASAGIESAGAELLLDIEPADHAGETWAGSADWKESAVGRGAFTLSRRTYGAEGALPYGIEDEASKLNLKTATEERLLRLEGMDQELVDALLDWQDTDTEARAQGAENEYYETLAAPYSCKDAPLTTLRELLLVRGFDETILFGEDRNGNGVLDPNENDGDALPPHDNKDGILDLGLLAYVTIYSTDRNVTRENQARADINAASASDLRNKISSLTEQEANAIVQYREKTKFENLGDLLKVTEATQQSGNQQDGNRQSGSGTSRSGRSSRSGSGGGNDSSGGGSSGGSESRSGSGSDSNSGSGSNSGSNSGSDSGRRSNSNSGSDSGRRSDSSSDSRSTPQSSSGSGKKVFTADRLKEIIDGCAIGGDALTPGRININTAPAIVLRTLPGVTEELAEAIVARRNQPSGAFQNIAELLDVSGMTEEIFTPLSNLVTVRSYQFQVKSRARIEGVNSQVTITAVLDRTSGKIRALYWNEE